MLSKSPASLLEAVDDELIADIGIIAELTARHVPTMPEIREDVHAWIDRVMDYAGDKKLTISGSATFDADFTNMTVDSTLDITINQVNWLATGFGSIGAQSDPVLPAHQFSGNYSVVVGGATGGSGQFAGFFSAPGQTSDPSFPGSAGLTYSLTDANSTTTVSGAAIFGNP